MDCSTCCIPISLLFQEQVLRQTQIMSLLEVCRVEIQIYFDSQRSYYVIRLDVFSFNFEYILDEYVNYGEYNICLCCNSISNCSYLLTYLDYECAIEEL